MAERGTTTIEWFTHHGVVFPEERRSAFIRIAPRLRIQRRHTYASSHHITQRRL